MSALPWANNTCEVAPQITALQRRNSNAWLAATTDNGWLGTPQGTPPALRLALMNGSAVDVAANSVVAEAPRESLFLVDLRWLSDWVQPNKIYLLILAFLIASLLQSVMTNRYTLDTSFHWRELGGTLKLMPSNK